MYDNEKPNPIGIAAVRSANYLGAPAVMVTHGLALAWARQLITVRC